MFARFGKIVLIVVIIIGATVFFQVWGNSQAKKKGDNMRSEYPRPSFKRSEWVNLNGVWEFAFDDENVGEKEGWSQGTIHFGKDIMVPFSFESELSGIGDTSFHKYVWYKKIFTVPEQFQGQKIHVNFGAVDYVAKVWINGKLLGSHIGGYTPFSFDITDFLKEGKNILVVKAEDSKTTEQARGKQSWKLHSFACFYTRTTGIWQTVWLEPLPLTRVEKVRLHTNINRSTVHFDVWIKGKRGPKVLQLYIITPVKKTIAFSREFRLSEDSQILSFDVAIPDAQLWSPEDPNLYQVKIQVQEGKQYVDQVETYFGMRDISVEGGKILLNNKPYYLRMVLDQGYFPEGIYTGSSDQDYRKDIIATKKFGFNAVRKHQKIEDPRYLYWADKLGLLVWEEAPSFHQWSEKATNDFRRMWKEIIERDCNHPCIIAWVPFNESWGINDVEWDKEQQQFVVSIYELTRSLDSTRLIVDNSGWEHTKTDIIDIHNYTEDPKVFSSLDTAPDRTLMASGFNYTGQPVVISEYGGMAFKEDSSKEAKEWGYGSVPQTMEEYLARYEALTKAIIRQDIFSGFCFTQLYDIEQEINGLMTYWRKEKVPPQSIAEINQFRP